MAKKITIIEAGRTFAELADRRGDFADWVAAGMGLSRQEVKVVPAFAGSPLPAAEETAAVVVPGSHAMVTDREPWSEKLADWLGRIVARDIPVLGICFGHQLLAHALGGTVGFHPAGGEFGTVAVRLLPGGGDDPLLGGLPAVFPAQVFHRQSVLRLPPGARALAASSRESHQAVRFAPRAWGVQFHPEFDDAVTAAYLDFDSERLIREGFDPAALRADLCLTPVAATLLQRFRRLVYGDEPEASG
jgi:GMP synthase (glutamine-hydrolysing)